MLALPWRRFRVSVSGGEFTIAGQRILASEGASLDDDLSAEAQTGLTAWDGALVLAKFLERSVALRGRGVIELGSGTGLASAAAAALGASPVLATDLASSLGNVRATAALNEDAIRATGNGGGPVVAMELDWLRPPSRRDLAPALGAVDVVLLADVVWVEWLVRPLVRALRLVADCILAARRGAPRIYLAHETRSVATDERLWSELAAHGFSARAVPDAQLHPAFRAPGVITVYEIAPDPEKCNR